MEKKMSFQGGGHKKNEFSNQVNKDLLNPWPYMQGMVGDCKTE